MRILITASSREKARNYVRYVGGMGEVEVITPEDVNLPDYDVLLLSGGGDVHPKFYGEDIKYPDLVETDEGRDRLELTLIGRSLAEGKPILGICRGLQILTVALGGALYQDLGEEGFDGGMHRARDGDAHHPVRFYGRFLEVFGERGEVNSSHHQGLKVLPQVPDLEVLAVSPDGLIEAFQIPSLKLLALQWHPERHASPISQGVLEYAFRSLFKVA